MDWTDFWKQFLDKNKLNNIVKEIDSVSSSPIEDVCHKIYDKYDKKILERIRLDFIQEIEKFSDVHLSASRVKEIESVLRKVIIKRYERMMDQNNRYSFLSADNYDRIITDLIGIRFILSYRGNWKNLHSIIVNRFPYLENEDYSDDRLIPIREDMDFIAELPHAYYSYGDDISIYSEERVKPLMRTSGYRSIHYVICYSGTYIEVQVRTIYDEAWSDCDHNFVYKHEENISHAALLELSKILCQYTNTCNEVAELMKIIFDNSDVVEKNNKYYASEEIINRLDIIFDKYNSTQNQFLQFKNNVCLKGEKNNE